MEDFKNNSASEMLTLLLDGEIPPELEQSLYDSLAKEEELQTEMKEHLAIRELVRSDVEAFTPPADFTNAVFANLGFQVPQVASLGLAANQSRPFYKKWKYALLLLLLLGTGASIALINNQSSDIKAITNSNSNIKDSDAQKSLDKNNIPVVSSISSNQIQNTKNTKSELNASANKSRGMALRNEKPAANDIAIANQSNNQITNELNINKESNIENNDLTQLAQNSEIIENVSPVLIISPIRSFSGRYYSLNSGISINTRMPSFVFGNNSNFDRKWIIYGRAIKNIYGDAYSKSNNLSESFSIGILASTGIADNLSLGAEFGTEPYLQDVVLNNKASYENQSTLNWFGVAARYDFKNLSFMNINPYTQVVVAGSGIGPLARLSLGFSYESPAGIGAMINLEDSYLMYISNGNLNSFNKIGLSGGVFIKF